MRYLFNISRVASRCGGFISNFKKITAEGMDGYRQSLLFFPPNSVRFTAHSFILPPAASCFNCNANPTPPHREITRHRQENHAPTPRRHRPNRKSRPSLGIVARDIDGLIVDSRKPTPNRGSFWLVSENPIQIIVVLCGHWQFAPHRTDV